MAAAPMAFLFPGQGSQSLGMLADLAGPDSPVAETFEAASRVLGYDLWDVCQNGPESVLNSTETTQPAMLVAGIATWRCWVAAGGTKPSVLAGHSLGEYSALVAAGWLGFEDAVRVVALRGKLMQSATPPGVGAMAAILGLEDAVLTNLCEAYSGEGEVSCANFNSPGQVVISGHRAAVEALCEQASAAGARRAIVLPVSVPSHCSLMRPAAEQLSEHLQAIAFAEHGLPVLQNADVTVHDNPGDIRDALLRQLWQPVRWTETIQQLVAQGTSRFFECGPGKVLAGLNRRIDRDASITALTDMNTIHTAIAEQQGATT